MKSFSYYERTSYLKDMETEQFDLVIVGGGINGAGVARDACSRGMKVALVELQDFAEGTSSRSSKLIHGGIRYLENMEFKLVFEALNERTKLFAIAPHLSHHLRFMIPLFKDSRVGMLKMWAGMILYDVLALFQAPELHQMLSAKETKEHAPNLRSHDLKGSFLYSDGYMDDDRLVHETLRSAHELGLKCANYVEAIKPHFNSENHIVALECKDLISNKTFKIRGKHFVSTVGPWTDLFAQRVFSDWKKMLRPTKGVHITLNKNRFQLEHAVVMGAQKSDRIVFAIPRHEMVIIGTTDTDFQGDPKNVKVEQADIDYLLEVTKDYFPTANITQADIVSTYAGVRPLVHDGSSTEGKTSREHVILDDDRGMTFVAGGKYTTYRLMSEQVVDHCLNYFSEEDQIKFYSSQTEIPLNPYVSSDSWNLALSQVWSWSKKLNRPLPECQLLAERYGMEAKQFLFDEENLDLSYIQIEARIAIEKTMCLHLTDFCTRRVPLYLAYPDHGFEQIDEIAEVFRALLGWDEKTVAREKAEYQEFISRSRL
ncbi:MAG: FAD-dependent oxidoreductase [Pseudobdellovibrionaceae bacterium]